MLYYLTTRNQILWSVENYIKIVKIKIFKYILFIYYLKWFIFYIILQAFKKLKCVKSNYSWKIKNNQNSWHAHFWQGSMDFSKIKYSKEIKLRFLLNEIMFLYIKINFFFNNKKGLKINYLKEIKCPSLLREA